VRDNRARVAADDLVGHRFLDTIERRIDYLAARVRDGLERPHAMQRSRAELKALRWAVKMLSEAIVQRRLRALGMGQDDER